MEASNGKVGGATLVAYAVPAVGYAFYLIFVQVYFLFFATEVLLAPYGLMGLLFGLGRLWDGVSDPLVGSWSDRTRSRMGRRRPWMLAAIPLMMASFTLVWSPPEGLSTGQLAAWCAVALLLFYTSYTIYFVPHVSLGAELSLDYHQRSRIFGAQRMAFLPGIMLAFLAVHYATTADAPRRAALEVSLYGGLAASALLLVAPLLLRERPEFRGRGASSPFAAMRDVLGNGYARILLAAWFVESLGGGVLAVCAPYISTYVLKRPDLVAVLPAFFIGFGVLGIPLWVRLSGRFGKRPVWIAALSGNAVFFALTFWVGEGDIVLICVLLAGAGLCNICGGVIGSSMMADVIDWDELRSGERKEGAYLAAWGFALKLASGLVVALTGVALGMAGFEPKVDQTPLALLTLQGIFAALPSLSSLGAILALLRFRFDRAAHAEVRAQLDARGAAAEEAQRGSA